MTADAQQRFEDRLLVALLGQHPALTTAPPAQLARVVSPSRFPRRRAGLLVLAAAAALVVVAGGLTTAREARPQAPIRAVDVDRIIYQADRALSRVPSDYIGVTRQVDETGVHGRLHITDENLMWQRTTGQGKRTVQAWRQEQLYPSGPDARLRLDLDSSYVYRHGAVTGRIVNYQHRAWFADSYPRHDAYPPLTSNAQDARTTLQLLRDGTFYMIGRVRLDGRPAIEIARRGQEVRIWFVPGTYLCLQDEQRGTQTTPSGVRYQTYSITNSRTCRRPTTTCPS